MANVQDVLENQFNGTPYTPSVEYSDNFFAMPYGYKDVQANEIFVEDILRKASNIDPQKPPQKIRNYGIEIQFEHTSAGKGMIQTTSPRRVPTDPSGAISDRLQQKAEKQRGYRPLLIVLDSELSFFDLVDLEKIVLGTSVAPAGGTKPAPLIQRYSRVWEKYMQQNDVLNIPAGRVGLFAENEFSRIAGVLLIDVAEDCHLVPNCYTDNLSIREIYQRVSGVVDNFTLSKVV